MYSLEIIVLLLVDKYALHFLVSKHMLYNDLTTCCTCHCRVSVSVCTYKAISVFRFRNCGIHIRQTHNISDTIKVSHDLAKSHSTGYKQECMYNKHKGGKHLITHIHY